MKTTSIPPKGTAGTSAGNPHPVLAAAEQYVQERGWSVVPLSSKDGKACQVKGWQKLRLKLPELAAYFAPGVNVGVLLGPVSGQLVDVDLDCDEAVQLAPQFLPPTGLISGRPSKLRSHWWYISESILPKQYRDPVTKKMICELRGGGEQTMVPPSLHPDGEACAWDQDGQPAAVPPAELVKRVEALRDAVLAQRYPHGVPHSAKAQSGAAPPKGGPAGTSPAESHVGPEVLARAAAYLASLPAAVSGHGGHDTTFAAACALVQGFALEPAVALEMLSEHYNPRCKPPWTAKELEHKVQDAAKAPHDKPKGYLLNAKPAGAKKQELSKLLEQPTAEAELFHDRDHRAYATVPVGGHYETHTVQSAGFRHWLQQKWYELHKRTLASQKLHEALDLLEGRAIYAGSERPVHVRVAGYEGNIYVDLGDPGWRCVVVTPQGWGISAIANHPVRFVRPTGMQALLEPVTGGSVSDLKPFLRLDDRDFVLLVAWLIGTFRPGGPYALLFLYGVQGTGKSTACRMLKALVDPGKAPVRSEPRSEHDLAIAASNSWCLAFDNLSAIAPWLSDALCRLSTGGGFATRKLYSDEGQTIFDFQRPVIVNGIEELATRPDLLDRGVCLTLRRIGESQRRPEGKLWQEFRAAAPKVLGAVLDAVAVALKREPDLHDFDYPRMADFARWVVAAEPALPWTPGTFLDAYRANIGNAKYTAIEASPACATLLAWAAKHGGWKGTYGQLLKELEAELPCHPSGSPIRPPAWPRSPRGLSNLVRRSAPSLEGAGLVVHDLPRQGKQGERLIRLEVGVPQPQPTTAAGSPADQSAADGTDGTDGTDGATGAKSSPFPKPSKFVPKPVAGATGASTSKKVAIKKAVQSSAGLSGPYGAGSPKPKPQQAIGPV